MEKFEWGKEGTVHFSTSTHSDTSFDWSVRFTPTDETSIATLNLF